MLDTQTWSPAPKVARSRSGAPELSILAGTPAAPPREYLIVTADDQLTCAYRRLRHTEFVERQQLFDHTDLDDVDADPRTVVLVAVTGDGTAIGGVRVAPCTPLDIGWWSGSRLVVTPRAATSGVGAALINAACAFVESAGALRFDACVQDRYAGLFRSLGWADCGPGETLRGRAHRQVRWPIGRIQATVDATKSVLAQALAPLSRQPGGLGPAGFRGDDGVPVPGSEIVAACDAILPSMVERDPRWAGWCAVLVNLNDLAAMGARPVGLLDAVGAPTTAHLSRIIDGIAAAAQAWRTPVLGGHTQVGVPSALSVTALGTTPAPLPAGGGRVGDVVSLTADLGGSWRPGYTDRQWDSTSSRTSDELVAMGSLVAQLRPRAVKDVSMAGLAGTLGMLAEASGTGAELDVAAIPRPRDVTMGAWLTCFPGFAMLTADREPRQPHRSPATSAACGRLTADAGVRLRWPDGAVTTAVASTVTGLGTA
ncbi:AIR synthase [Gordonia sp. TBRC 11910]|uniref:AIR synthase n=1 Tax=Gordonia asplenii TaxID=2725283 RepID=A0A848KWF2_9ACTN|nr:MSMEG_0567/sll0787 family protein [Gordonia asplenii]NMO02572.1 AIR synthase [Gordonia asplenii]